MKNSLCRLRCCAWLWIVLLILLFLTPLAAHDFWIASSEWVVKPGATIVVTANVGDGTFPKSDSLTRANRIDSLRIVGPGAKPIAPMYRESGKELTAEVTLPSSPATYVVAMQVKGHFLSMPAEEFEKYLKEEGLDQVVAERARIGETKSPSRERYSREAKMLIRAGTGANEHVTKPIGLVAELVPDSDFSFAHVGDTVGVHLFYQGQPVRQAQVTLTSSAASGKESKVLHSRTDDQGHAQFTIAEKGPTLVATVVMVRRTGEKGPQAADWASYWCSLTFAVSN